MQDHCHKVVYRQESSTADASTLISILQAQLASKDETIKQLRDDKAEMRREYQSKISRLEEKLRDARDMKTKHDVEMTSLQAKVDDLTKNYPNSEKMRKECNKRILSMEKQHEINQRLFAKQLLDYAKREDKLQKKNKDLEKQILSQQTEIRQNEEKIAEIEEKMAQLILVDVDQSETVKIRSGRNEHDNLDKCKDVEENMDRKNENISINSKNRYLNFQTKEMS